MIISRKECENKTMSELMKLAAALREDVENSALSGEINEDSLESLYIVTEEVIEFTRTYLITSSDRFYGSFLFALDVKIDFKLDAPAAVSIRKPINMKINPLRWVDMSNGKNYTYLNFVADVVHELLHLVFGHPADMILLKDYYEGQFKKLNYAADAAVNDIIIHDTNIKKGGLKLTNDVITSSTIKEMYEKQTGRREWMKTCQDLYYYLEYLDKLKDQSNNNQQGGCGTSAPNNSNNQSPNFNSKNKGEISTRFNSTGNDNHNFGIDDSDEYSDVKASIREKVRVVWDSLDEEDRKNLSGSLKTAITDLLEPDKLDWREMLSKYIGTLPAYYKKTITRKNRRQPYRNDLMGRLRDRIVDLVIAIDTSGSMTEDDLRKVISVIQKIMKDRPFRLEIVECDTKIGKTYEISNFEEFDFNISGGGGTQFSPVFEYMARDINRYQNSLLIYMTDGGGEQELSVRPVNSQVLWLITDGDESNLSVIEPFGEVRSLEDDKRF